jgi:hypothetical protein
MSDLIEFADAFALIAIPLALLILAVAWGTTWLDDRWQRHHAARQARREAQARAEETQP